MSTKPPGLASLDYASAGGYPVGMVATLAGLSVDVIRVWERRYGVPQPVRSVGGHRLYSPRDVNMLRHAAALRAQGHTAAAACAQALALAESTRQAPDSGAAASPIAASLAARLHDAALVMDGERAHAVLAEASALVDVESLWSDVIAPTLVNMGEHWEHGTATPAPEHLLSCLVRGRLSTIMDALPRQPDAPSAVIGAAPGEQHDLAALMFALLLTRTGWKVTFLGADTPPDALETAIGAIRPRVAVVTATLSRNANAAFSALRYVQDSAATGAPVLACGGPAFSTANTASTPVGGEHPLGTIMRLDDDVGAAVRQLAMFR